MRVPNTDARTNRVRMLIETALVMRGSVVDPTPIVDGVLSSHWVSDADLIDVCVAYMDAAIHEDRDVQISSRNDPYGLLNA